MDGRTSYVSDKDVYREIDKAILRSSHGGYGTLSEKEELRRQMFYSIRGFDVLEKYLGDSSISEIMVIGASRIFVEQNGKIRRIEEHFSEEGDVYRLIEQIVAPTNRMVNEACPIVDSRLPDGSRVHIVLPPVSLEGPVITIRKFLKGGINNYIFTGKDTQMKTHINTMASAITGVMGMPQTMKAVQVLIRMAISYGESLLELHTLFSGGEVPLIKDKTTWNLTLKTMAEQLRNKQIVKKGKKNISYKDYLKLFLLTKGNSRTVCYRMMDIMQENIASKEPGFLMENCLFSYSWKGSLAAGGVKLNFVKQCSY